MTTQAELKELFHYCPDTGNFTRLKVVRQYKVGDIAGWISVDGYRNIRIKSKNYREHRLVWLYLYGEMPANHIDHINGNKADNRLSNLRDATRAENGMNRSAYKNSASPHKGVQFHKSTGKWMAKCTVYGESRYLGLFATADLASAAYESYTKVAFGQFYREPALLLNIGEINANA